MIADEAIIDSTDYSDQTHIKSDSMIAEPESLKTPPPLSITPIKPSRMKFPLTPPRTLENSLKKKSLSCLLKNLKSSRVNGV